MDYKQIQKEYRERALPKVIYNKGGTVDLSIKKFKHDHAFKEVGHYKAEAWELVKEQK